MLGLNASVSTFKYLHLIHATEKCLHINSRPFVQMS